MTTATKQFRNRIAVIFDFDKTLAPGTFDLLLKELGYEDTETFWEEQIRPLNEEQGWEEILARAYRIIQESKSRDDLTITAEYLEKIGQKVEFYAGVPEMFDRVRATARNIIDDIEVEFYLLTAGFIEIPRGTSIASEFTAMWGSKFHFNDAGEVEFVKEIVTHPEKVRYILQFSKGLEARGPGRLADVYKDVPEEEIYIPLSQIIYVGDGGSDMPVFSLMNERRGIALGVFGPEKSIDEWIGYSDMDRGTDRRVQNLARADFSDGAELMQSLTLAVESVCKQIALRRLSIDE